MHGCGSTSVSLVDAEIDSMGEVVEGGVVITTKKSPRSAAIEKVQRELRQEYNVREERKRELEFLENGGNPLEFKFGNDASVSVQSTSFIEQNPYLVATSEAKSSFAFTESPRGDSVESSDRPGPPICESNSADNLMLFDADSEGNHISSHPHKSYLVQSEPSFQINESRKTFELEDSTTFGLPKKAYRRRYRSRRNRDGTRSNLGDVNPTCGSHDSLVPSGLTFRDEKDLVSCSKNEHMPSNCNSENTSPVDVTQQKTVLPDDQQDIELDGAKVIGLTEDFIKGVPVDVSSDNVTSDNFLDDQHNPQLMSHSAVTPMQLNSNQPDVQRMEEMVSAVFACKPGLTFVSQSRSCQMNGFSFSEGDTQVTNTHRSISCSINGLNFTQNSTDIDEKYVEKNHESKNVGSNGNIEGNPFIEGDESVEEEKQIEGVVSSTLLNEETASACQILRKDGCSFQPSEELTVSCMNQLNIGVEYDGATGSESMNSTVLLSGDISGLSKESMNNIEHHNSIDIPIAYHADVAIPTEASSVPIVTQKSSGLYSELGREKDEDSILKEAQIIETKRNRIMELSIVTPPVETRLKSQWDYVLEEMAWLANDFAQERIWKITASAKMCHRATFSLKVRKQENYLDKNAKKVAHSLAKGVIGFWQSVKEQNSQKNSALAVEAYASDFLMFNYSNILQSQAEVPLTPDRTSDSGIPDLSWDDSLTEENLFYTVTTGAIETYRNSIEFYESQRERIGDIMQEEVEISECDAMADKVYDEGEGDISGYDMPIAFEGGDNSSRFCQKMLKQFIHSYGGRPCEVGSYESGLQYAGMKVVARQSASQLKRTGNSLKVSIPTKRVRTASRRIISAFSAGTSGCMVAQNRTDASSGDTSSFQDDQSTLRGGSFVPHGLESDLVGEFEKQLPFDSAEISTKFKKKPKHLNVAHKQRWQVDPGFQYDQRGYWKKGSDVYQHESNGSDALSSQPLIKKLKMRHSHDIFVDNNFKTIGGSVTSPAASQMSNMSNPNKIVKMFGGRDRDCGRKPKVLKQIPSGYLGSESPWSHFEDQALVVLVHDLGPNWELISDSINDTLHFKCIFRKPKDCKERHIVLMDETCGDGADSADDSGTSQPYPSTLPGIPKGSARQLFQRLQEPVDEDTLNSHFDKIIMLGHKQHNRKVQDPKQLQQPHPSHTIALSQVCPNNLTGGLVLTPLDFYEATLAGPDMLSLGYQGPNSRVSTNPNQRSGVSMLPASGVNSSLQGSPAMLQNNNVSSSPASFSSARYGEPRSGSLSVDDQQRIHHYNQIISARNISQHNLAAPGLLRGTDHCARVLPGGNGLGMVTGISRSMPSARPGLQGGVALSSMLNSGSMVSPAIASSNIPSGGGSGSSLLRPREASHMMRDPQRQMMTPDLQMQVSPGSRQGMPFFSGSSSPFPNQTASPPVSSYSIHHQQHHPVSPQQPQVLSPHHPHFQGHARHLVNPQHRAYAMCLAKERQLKQQRFLQQQSHQQFTLSNSLAPHMQSQSQLPISSPVQNNSQLQSQTTSPPVSLSPPTPVTSMSSMPLHQQKHHTSAQISDRNAQASTIISTNQMGKQRQRQQQQFSQANRQHPQQRQQLQSQQQAKVLNGAGRLNSQLHQTIPVDPSLLNGVTGNQCLENGEPAAPIIQNQGLYSSSTQNTEQQLMRQFISSQSSNQSLSQQKAYSSQASSSSTQQQMTSHSDANTYGNVSPITTTDLPAIQQSVPNLAIVGENHPQASPNQKLADQIQPFFQRVHPTSSSNSNTSHKPQAREFDTGQHPASGSSESNTLTLKSNENFGANLSCLPSTISSSREPVLQAGQGHVQRPPPTSLPPTGHDINPHWQQQPSHLQHSQQLAPSPPQQPSPQQQQPLVPLHSQQQGKLLQAGNGNLYGRPGDTRIQ